jgi:hypothetical protein
MRITPYVTATTIITGIIIPFIISRWQRRRGASVLIAIR